MINIDRLDTIDWAILHEAQGGGWGSGVGGWQQLQGLVEIVLD